MSLLNFIKILCLIKIINKRFFSSIYSTNFKIFVGPISLVTYCQICFLFMFTFTETFTCFVIFSIDVGIKTKMSISIQITIASITHQSAFRTCGFNSDSRGEVEEVSVFGSVIPSLDDRKDVDGVVINLRKFGIFEGAHWNRSATPMEFLQNFYRYYF